MDSRSLCAYNNQSGFISHFHLGSGGMGILGTWFLGDIPKKSRYLKYISKGIIVWWTIFPVKKVNTQFCNLLYSFPFSLVSAWFTFHLWRAPLGNEGKVLAFSLHLNILKYIWLYTNHVVFNPCYNKSPRAGSRFKNDMFPCWCW